MPIKCARVPISPQKLRFPNLSRASFHFGCICCFAYSSCLSQSVVFGERVVVECRMGYISSYYPIKSRLLEPMDQSETSAPSLLFLLTSAYALFSMARQQRIVDGDSMSLTSSRVSWDLYRDASRSPRAKYHDSKPNWIHEGEAEKESVYVCNSHRQRHSLARSRLCGMCGTQGCLPPRAALT